MSGFDTLAQLSDLAICFVSSLLEPGDAAIGPVDAVVGVVGLLLEFAEVVVGFVDAVVGVVSSLI